MANRLKYGSSYITNYGRIAAACALLLLLVTGSVIPGLGSVSRAYADETPWPTAPPAQVCGDTDLLSGPLTAPAGAVTVPAGSNVGFNFNQPGATFWFESGVHTLGDDIYGQIIARNGATYVGAPGAIIDGQNLNLYAFTGYASDVTIKHLTIVNFGRGNDNNNEGVVNHDAGDGWTVEYNTISGNDGAGVFLGSDNVVRYNCLKENGQYGFSMFKEPIEGDSAIKNITLDHNEIAGNNTDNWESQIEGCGCTGAGKFWDVNGATVTNNWVHDNLSTGLWADTNNIDFLFEGNYIENNAGEGIWYEISYNATIRSNTFKHNAWTSGQRNTGSPGAAVYLSESGGDARLDYSVSGAPKVRIYNNNFDNNFSGVSIYENANRFCNSNGNTSKGYCTPFVTPTLLPEEPRSYDYPDPISTEHPCYTNVSEVPYTKDCRWHSKNIEVNNNEFRFDETVVPCKGNFCGVQALYANGSNNMPWSPYTVVGVQNDVMFANDNTFYDNAYFGNWRFAKGYGETIGFNSWQSAPYNQDAGSSFDGDVSDPENSQPSTPPTTPQSPTIVNHLDGNTSGLENGAGQWADWYSASTKRTDEAAHSGTHSLRVDVTAPWGWGAELANWPGFEVTPGAKVMSFWGKLGSGNAVQPKMTVKWIDENYTSLRTDAVTLPVLTNQWQQVSSVVDAPSGAVTALVFLTDSSAKAGDYLYLDDMVVGIAPNQLPVDSATFENASSGQWQNWYSASVATTSDAAHSGSGSMRIGVTAPWGWAVQIGNWPGFAASPGAKRISYWAKQDSGKIGDITLRLKWYSADQQLVQTDTLPLTLSGDWGQATADIVAPEGAATVYLDAYSDSGASGDSLLIDDISIINL